MGVKCNTVSIPMRVHKQIGRWACVSHFTLEGYDGYDLYLYDMQDREVFNIYNHGIDGDFLEDWKQLTGEEY